ncbi:hypothetical protein BTVI_12740 [Pitangus sulphuratus]|nr:hypothetical protein BTVI_12740 [Pitangus sulphuratus]
MTQPVLGWERTRLSPLDMDLSPVPQADLASAPSCGLGAMQHPAQGIQGAFPAHAQCQLALGHNGHSAIACTLLGTASPGLTHPPGSGLTAQ